MMITKEYVRIRLHAAPEAVIAWLGAMAETAAAATRNPYSVAPLGVEGQKGGLLDELLRYGLYPARDSSVPPAPILTATVWREGVASVVVELRCSAAFPLSAAELMDDLAERFSIRSALALTAPQHTDAGAPPLACNVWLEEELRRLPDPERQAHALYEGWLERYIALRGAAPAEPRRSFRSAVRSRLNHIRGENSRREG